MDRFPEFIRDTANAVASRYRSEGVHGYVFDGAKGSQAVLFECHAGGVSKEHVHPFDEYFLVIQGEYTLGIEGREITMKAGQEYHIPPGVPHDGRFIPGTRTINVFGGKRAEREG
ncbi:MAG: hypothetical protein A2010_05625 [Nitrospirae bacterium GWD2_57_9]|nr:MAG: hypothetical protein A2010_05625 [Nitrospirae bacterium GWD2_57_9]